MATMKDIKKAFECNVPISTVTGEELKAPKKSSTTSKSSSSTSSSSTTSSTKKTTTKSDTSNT